MKRWCPRNSKVGNMMEPGHRRTSVPAGGQPSHKMPNGPAGRKTQDI